MIDINKVEKLLYIKDNKQFYCAKFVNKLTPDHYGIQRFITEDGDICILYLLRDGIPEGYKDVEQIYLEVMKYRKQIKKFEGSWVGINDRYAILQIQLLKEVFGIGGEWIFIVKY
jgi:hypothetical protein